MFVNQWEMAKDEPQLIFESSLESFNDGIRAAAIGTFKIAVGHQRDRSSIESDDMVLVLEEQTRFGMNGRPAHERSLPAHHDRPASLLSPSCAAHLSAVFSGIATSPGLIFDNRDDFFGFVNVTFACVPSAVTVTISRPSYF